MGALQALSLQALKAAPLIDDRLCSDSHAASFGVITNQLFRQANSCSGELALSELFVVGKELLAGKPHFRKYVHMQLIACFGASFSILHSDSHS